MLAGMKPTIWKFPAPIRDRFVVEMPEDAEILTVQNQGDEPCIWALVQPDLPLERRFFHWYGTGHDVDLNDPLDYVGTVQQLGGRLVFHLFVETPRAMLVEIPSHGEEAIWIPKSVVTEDSEVYGETHDGVL